MCSKDAQKQLTQTSLETHQCAKKVISDSLGSAGFAVVLGDSVVCLPDGQVKFFGEIF